MLLTSEAHIWAAGPNVFAAYRLYQIWYNFSSLYFLNQPIDVFAVTLPQREPDIARVCAVVFPPTSFTKEQFRTSFLAMYGLNFSALQLPPSIFKSSTGDMLLDLARKR